jgi:electron transport complex protein RnfD
MSAEPALHPLIVTPGPHLHVEESTARIMWWVNGVLAPAVLWGAFVFGYKVLAVTVAAILGAMAAEWIGGKTMKVRYDLRDGSTVCTGLLLALTLPPLVAPWMALLGGFFAIFFAKTLFGGLGYNLFNPALIGRAFMMATFPVAMTTGWGNPREWFASSIDAVTTATPLAVLREQGITQAMDLLGGPQGPWASLVLGFRPGSIGEVSVVLLALGAGILLARKIITLTIPLSIFAGVILVTSFTGDLALHLLSGGLWIGAFFMATDYVTSPTTRNGQIVFGLTIGILTAVIRVWGGYPEGICYAILLANTLVPALNTWFRPKRTQVAGVPS